MQLDTDFYQAMIERATKMQAFYISSFDCLGDMLYNAETFGWKNPFIDFSFTSLWIESLSRSDFEDLIMLLQLRKEAGKRVEVVNVKTPDYFRARAHKKTTGLVGHLEIRT